MRVRRSLHRLRVLSIPMVFFLLYPLAGPGTARAQEIGGRLGIEILKPGIDATKMFNGAAFLHYTRDLGERYTLHVSLPLARFHKDTAIFDDESELLLGNPYVGAVRSEEDSPLFFRGGLRLPIASSERPFAQLMGSYADLTRVGAFGSRTFLLEGAAGYGGVLENGVEYTGSAGPLVSIPTGGDGDSELYLGAAVSARYPLGESLLSAVGFSGLYRMGGGSSAGDDLIMQGTAGLAYDLGWIRPGISGRLPLNRDWADAVDGVLGLHLSLPLP